MYYNSLIVDSLLTQILDLKKHVLALRSRCADDTDQIVYLEKDNVFLKRKIQGLENEIKELKKRVEVVDVVKGMSLENSDSVSFARTRVNNLIRDIDKCITLLNE